MIGRCVGGHWPPLRLGNVQMVDKRCAEVAPQAPSLALRAIHLAAPYGKIG